MFSDNDLQLLEKKGISIRQINEQLEAFRKGIDFVTLYAPATPGSGIMVPGEKEIDRYNELFSNGITRHSFTRFIPASGAASRMFKALFETLDKLGGEADFRSFLEGNKEMTNFLGNIHTYPFYEDLLQFTPVPDTNSKESTLEVLRKLLLDKGLNYGSLPKGLLKFHRYPDGSRTAFEEHFIEASQYLTSDKNTVKLHFTVSPEHRELFQTLSKLLTARFWKAYKIDFKVSFSEQKPSTDTIAVNPDNTPFRTENGELLFRPGGHGALLENLNDLDEEIVFIGNIDNISPDRTKSLRIKYKKLLGGILIEKTGRLHEILRRIADGEKGKDLRMEINSMIKEISPYFYEVIKELQDTDYYDKAFKFMNKPVRVCGMVKNVGEPGGGPFWIKTGDGQISKQIIESSQINLENKDQKTIFESATHFNPVDLACYIRDYRGNKFNLLKFRDPGMAFISSKSQGGKELKALELPGLWNGSMAHWLSWFVDVPIETFTPVKTVFDLVRSEHT